MSDTILKNEPFHVTVLLDEAVQALNIKDKGIYVDATFGGGGHTRRILESNSTCKVVGLDWDKEALKLNGAPITEQFGDRFIPVFGNFTQIFLMLKKAKINKVDGILADFGTSQTQLKHGAGFSFSTDTPLDMRMSRDHTRTTAADIVAYASEHELATIFWRYGEERMGKKIAQRIVEQRKIKRITTTQQLADLVKRAIPMSQQRTSRLRKTPINPATKVFQALRIVVNKELENIEKFLSASLQVLKDDGRFACISFHSLEDRIVKQYFKDLENTMKGVLLTKKPIAPSEEEVDRNPPSRSAKLRVFARKVH